MICLTYEQYIDSQARSHNFVDALTLIHHSITHTVCCSDNLQQLGRQLATHIVGMRPADVPELLSQTFVFDGARTVADVMKDAATSAGSAVDITGFVRCVGRPWRWIRWRYLDDGTYSRLVTG